MQLELECEMCKSQDVSYLSSVVKQCFLNAVNGSHEMDTIEHIQEF